MANFEGLIRGALSAKGATDAAGRSVVYQSSRNALQRLIAENRSITVENAVAEQQALETAIARIEAEYAAPEKQPVPKTDTSPQPSDPLYEVQQILAEDSAQRETAPSLRPAEPAPVQPAPAAQPQAAPSSQPAAPQAQVSVAAQQQTLEPQVALAQPASQPEPQPVSSPQPVAVAPAPAQPEAPAPDLDELYADEPVVVPSGFKRRRKSQALLWVVFLVILLAVLGWIGYRLALGIVDGSLFGYQAGGTSPVSRDVGQTDAQSDYITILEPGDLTAMVVSDRGRVEIINEQSLEMIRILSVRDKTDRAQSAKPILIKLKPGVLEQITGKRVTAEIYARSGSSTAAQFAVECEFGEGVGCGRKRFHVGVQPEASIFAFTMEQNRNTSRDAFIAINTDITDNAEITGEGDILDIVYIRLRTSKE